MAEQDSTHPISSLAVQGFSLHKTASCDVQCYIMSLEKILLTNSFQVQHKAEYPASIPWQHQLSIKPQEMYKWDTERVSLYLFMPTQVALKLPGWQLLERLEWFSIVLLHHWTKLFNAPIIKQILHAGHAPVIPASIVPLSGHYCFHCIQYILLWDIAEWLCQPRESCLHAMCPSHPSSNLHSHQDALTIKLCFQTFQTPTKPIQVRKTLTEKSAGLSEGTIIASCCSNKHLQKCQSPEARHHCHR